jgi:hypothetical protein
MAVRLSCKLSARVVRSRVIAPILQHTKVIRKEPDYTYTATTDGPSGRPTHYPNLHPIHGYQQRL